MEHNLRAGMRIILKKNYKLAVIEKKNPINTDEFIVTYYNEHNKLCYDSITEKDILPIEDYEKIKNRHNKINDIFRD